MLYPAPGFNVDATLNAIDQFKATNILGTPTMLNDMIAHPDLKVILMLRQFILKKIDFDNPL